MKKINVGAGSVDSVSGMKKITRSGALVSALLLFTCVEITFAAEFNDVKAASPVHDAVAEQLPVPAADAAPADGEENAALEALAAVHATGGTEELRAVLSTRGRRAEDLDSLAGYQGNAMFDGLVAGNEIAKMELRPGSEGPAGALLEGDEGDKDEEDEFADDERTPGMHHSSPDASASEQPLPQLPERTAGELFNDDRCCCGISGGCGPDESSNCDQGPIADDSRVDDGGFRPDEPSNFDFSEVYPRRKGTDRDKDKKGALNKAGSSCFAQLATGSVAVSAGFVCAELMHDQYGLRGLGVLAGGVSLPFVLKKAGVIKTALNETEKSALYGFLVGAGASASVHSSKALPTLELPECKMPTLGLSALPQHVVSKFTR